MMKPVLTLLATTALLAPLALAETKSFPAGDFSSINARGPIDVEFQTGPVPSIIVEQDDGDFSDIYIEQEGSELNLGRNSLRDKKGWARNVSVNVKNGRKIIKINGKRVPTYTVRVTAPALDGAAASQSARLDATGIASNAFSGSVSSSADLSLSGTAASADLRGSSSGDLDASAFLAESLTLDASSSSDIRAAVGGGSLDLEASSSTDVEVTAANTAQVLIDASSSADVIISGTCKDINISASSSADVEADDLDCVSGDIQASSGADITTSLSGSVKARASSGADISVHGNPASRDVQESSGGDIDFNG
jgi:hypothetical protein